MLKAFSNATDPTQRALEFIRLFMLLLVLVGWVMYPVELLILEHWAKSWQSHIPFILSIFGLVFTLWVIFDRHTPWVRTAFFVTMWAAVFVGLLGAYYHVLWNFDDEVKWSFTKTMEAVAGSRPVLAAMAFTHMGLTGILALYRAK